MSHTVTGKPFERRIATKLRAAFPSATFARANQADKARQSDVYCQQGPIDLMRCWFECHSALKPNEIKKLEQAERDIERAGEADALPFAVWHRRGSKKIHVTSRLWVFAELVDVSPLDLTAAARMIPITVDWPVFLENLLIPWVEFARPYARE